jgi:glucans biosynthesis protein C
MYRTQMATNRPDPEGVAVAGRLHFLDNLKTFIILLVVFFHSAYAYALYLSQDWYVVDPQQSLFFDVFIITTFAFMMPVMFFIAGYMGAASLVRKGQADFWRDKLRHIIIPWALGAIIVAPAIVYVAHASRGVYPFYLSYWVHYFSSQDYQTHGQVHFYFLCTLALYYVALSVVYRINNAVVTVSPGRPSGRFLVLFGLTTGILFFFGTLIVDEGRWVKIAIFDVPGARFIPFMCYFFLGVFAYKRRWFTPRGYSPRLRPWALLCAGSFIVFTTFLNKQLQMSTTGRVCYSLSQFLFCLAAVFSLFAIFQKRLNFTNRLLTSLSTHSYGTYFIHYLVIVAVILCFRGVHINVFLKWLLAGTVSAVVSCLISRYGFSLTPFFGLARPKGG